VTNPQIIGNIIIGNAAYMGGGIFHETASGKIENNIITDNQATAFFGWGGGIYLTHYADPDIKNNLFQGNWANYGGGGVYTTYFAAPFLSNNTFTNNAAKEWGGGMCCLDDSDVNVSDNVFWNNSAPFGREIYIGQSSKPSSVTIHHSNVDGGQALVFVEASCTLNWGAGMINADPLFTTGPDGFHYLSHLAAGQAADSPCLDSGSDLASNLGMDTLWTRTDEVPDAGTVDIGYHFGSFLYPSLQVDSFNISEAVGGSVNFLLLGKIANANRNYLILGSVSGASPGIPLPGGHVILPINWDIFTDIVINNINTTLFLEI